MSIKILELAACNLRPASVAYCASIVVGAQVILSHLFLYPFHGLLALLVLMVMLSRFPIEEAGISHSLCL